MYIIFLRSLPILFLGLIVQLGLSAGKENTDKTPLILHIQIDSQILKNKRAGEIWETDNTAQSTVPPQHRQTPKTLSLLPLT